MKQQFCLWATLLALLAGCQLITPVQQPVHPQPAVSPLDELYRQAQATKQREQVDEYAMNQNALKFNPMRHNLSLSNYVEQMALDLVDTMTYEDEMHIAVASFVEFDNNLRSTNQLGNQLSETFIHQLQKFGYGVVDFKTANSITVTANGDFSFSRELKRLAQKKVASHVLSGTMIYRSTGVEVNARIVDIESKQVIATSSKLVPSYVLQSADLIVSQFP
jgi:TolB-like protein